MFSAVVVSAKLQTRPKLLRRWHRTATLPHSSGYPQSTHDSTETALRVYEVSPP
jgi:hypothetical protein